MSAAADDVSHARDEIEALLDGLDDMLAVTPGSDHLRAALEKERDQAAAYRLLMGPDSSI